MFKLKLISPAKRAFIICGPVGTGKTVAFQYLTKGEIPALTVSSLNVSQNELQLDGEYSKQSTFKNIEVFDFPGNGKLKNLYLRPFLKRELSRVIGVIYMIDSSAFDKDKCHEIAQDLLELLKITESKPNGVDILLYCNKSDLFTSKKKNKVKELLQEEMVNLIEFNKRGLNKVSGNEDMEEIDDYGLDAVSTGLVDGKFQFQFLEGNVTFEEGNIWKQDKRSSMNDWIMEKVVN